MSPMGGGQNRLNLQLLDADGNLPPDSSVPFRVVGGHTGNFTGLNVCNPQAGWEYQWGRKNPNDIHSARIRGWRIVDSSDPEMAALRMNIYGEDSDTETPLDTSDVFQDVVFMKIPTEQLRIIREDQIKLNRERLESGAISAYLGGDAGDALGQPTRFTQRTHGVQYHGDGAVESQWAPDRGIIE